MIQPTDLRTDDDVCPLGLDNRQPAFSWVPDSAERNQRQTAYQVQVASSAQALAGGQADLWDSGKTASNASYAIEYQGQPLRSGQFGHWRVRLWDRDGRPSEWAAAASFGMGILDPAAWQAQWIGHGSANEPQIDFNKYTSANEAEKAYGPIPVDEGSTLLRREWTIAAPVRRAVAFVCGLGFYHLQVNGRHAGESALTPSKTDYRAQALYDAYDVTELLQPGRNALGLMLGNGWYNPIKDFWNWRMQWHGSKRALLQLHVEYADGSSSVLVTDGAWKWSAGPVVFNCLYNGETYDARQEQPGWDKPGFDEAAWQPANVVAPPGGVLRFHAMEPMRITQKLRPTAMWEARPGVFVFDLGQNLSGYMRLRVRGEAGASVVLRHAEHVFPDGTLDMGSMGSARSTDTYILKGDGEETYTPYFTQHGFQYVELSGFPGVPTLDSLEGCVVHSACRQTGEFRCADARINHIHHCTVWSQRGNLMGMPTDCPQRDERLGWMADAHLSAEECLCNFDAIRFYRKWLRDIRLSQNAAGDVPYIVPRPQFESTPAWSSAYPLVTWYLYQHTGDARILAEHFAGVKAYVDFLSTTARDGILPPDTFGDWLTVADQTKGGDPALATTFYYFYDAALAAQMAEILGHAAEAERFWKLTGTIRAAFHRAYYRKDANVYGGGSHCEMAMALFLDLAQDELRQELLEKLVGNITVTKQGHLSTGILGAKYAMDLLAREGYTQTAWQVVSREGYPGWIDMTRGCTTLAEYWDRRGSHNHVMFGCVDDWLYRAIAGIQTVPEAPGYARVRIQPFVPADLDWASGAIATPRGRVASAWRKTGEQLTLDVTIPPNTEAEIRLPEAQVRGGTVREGEAVVWQQGFRAGAEGVTGGERVDDDIALRVGSGRYRFVCDWIDRPAAAPAKRSVACWHSRFISTWRISRLQPPQDIASVPAVKLTDDLGWRPFDDGSFVCLHTAHGSSDGVAYAGNRFLVRTAGEWIIHVGHDGGARVFLDGKAIATEPARLNPAPRSRTTVPVSLAAGEHEIVIALDTDNGLGWGFFFSFSIPDSARKPSGKAAFPEALAS